MYVRMREYTDKLMYINFDTDNLYARLSKRHLKKLKRDRET